MKTVIFENDLDDNNIVVDPATGKVGALGTILNMNGTLPFTVDGEDPNTIVANIENGTWVDSNGNTLLVIGGKYVKLHSDSGWKELVLLNGFINYYRTYQTARYKVINNVLHVQGLIKDGALGKVIFKLPTEIASRIQNRQIMIVDISGDGNGRLDILSDGSVLAINFSPIWTVINFTVALDD